MQSSASCRRERLKNNWDTLPARTVGSSFPCITLVEPFIDWLLLHRHRQVEHSSTFNGRRACFDSLCALCSILSCPDCLPPLSSISACPDTSPPLPLPLGPIVSAGLLKLLLSLHPLASPVCPPPPSLRHTLSRHTYLTSRVIQQNALVYKPRVGFCCAIATQL